MHNFLQLCPYLLLLHNMDPTIYFELSLLFLYTEGLRIFLLVGHKFLYSRNFLIQNEWQEISPVADEQAVVNARLTIPRHLFLLLSYLPHESATKDEYISHLYLFLYLDAKQNFFLHCILPLCLADNLKISLY